MIDHYLTTALRHFRRHKLATLISVFGLAVGLTCFILAYAAITYLRQSDRHFASSDRIFYVEQRTVLTGTNAISPSSAWLSFVAGDLIKAQVPGLEQVARATFGEKASVSVQGTVRSAYVVYADPQFTDIFDFQFLRGERSALSSPHSAVITSALAARLFGSADPLGRSILLEGQETVEVRGVIATPAQPSHFGTGSSAAVRFEALVSMDTHRALIDGQLPADAANRVFTRWNFGHGYAIYLMTREPAAQTALLDEQLAHVASNIPKDFPAQLLSTHPLTQRWPRYLERMWSPSVAARDR